MGIKRLMRRIMPAVFVLLSAVYAWQGIGAARAVPEPVYCGDASLYQEVARYPLGSVKFWVWHRPWTVPLVHKLAGLNDPRVVRWQVAIGLVAHLVLAWILFRSLGSGALGLLAALGVYLYALATCVEGWAMVIRSESVAFSLTALFLGLLIAVVWQLTRPRPRTWSLLTTSVLFLLAAVLFVFSRDNWAYQLPLVALLLGISLLPARARAGRTRLQIWTGLILALLLLGVFATQIRTARLGDRSQPCLMNVLFQRVFTDPEIRGRWIEQYQMPWDDKLQALAGKWCFSNQYAGYKHKPFQDWLDRRGLGSYIHDVLTHPGLSGDAVWRNFRAIVNYFAMTEYLKMAGEGTAVTRMCQRLIFFPLPPNWAELAVILCLVIPLGVGLLAGRTKLAACGWGIFILAAGLPVQMAICFLADALEVMRHNLAVSITLRLLLVATLALTAAALARTLSCLRLIWRQEVRRRLPPPFPE